MERSGDEFYRKVAEGYRQIARDEPARVVVIRGSGSIDETHAAVWAEITKKLNITRDVP
jgi:thymidylate kinase